MVPKLEAEMITAYPIALHIQIGLGFDEASGGAPYPGKAAGMRFNSGRKHL